MSNAGQYGNAEGFLQDIANSLSGMQDPSAISNGFQTFELFSAAVGTGVTTTGSTLNVKASSSQMIMVDITGAGATGILCTLRGGISGFAMVTLRSWTGSGGSPGLYIFKNQAAGVTTGVAPEQTGFTRFDDMHLTIVNPASTTGGGSVTVRARAFLSPEF